MIHAGREVKKPKYKIGDIVKVKDLVSYVGKVTYASYRHEGHTGWHYKVRFPWDSTLTFSEGNLRKVRAKK